MLDRETEERYLSRSLDRAERKLNKEIDQQTALSDEQIKTLRDELKNNTAGLYDAMIDDSSSDYPYNVMIREIRGRLHEEINKLQSSRSSDPLDSLSLDILSIPIPTTPSKAPTAPKSSIPSTLEADAAFLELADLVASSKVKQLAKIGDWLLNCPAYRSGNYKNWMARWSTSTGKAIEFYNDPKRAKAPEKVESRKLEDKYGDPVKYDAYYQIPDNNLRIGSVVQFASDSYRGDDKVRIYGVFLGMTPSRFEPSDPKEDAGSFLYIHLSVNKDFGGKWDAAAKAAEKLAQQIKSLFDKQTLLANPYLGLLAPIPDTNSPLLHEDLGYRVESLASVPFWEYAKNRKKRMEEAAKAASESSEERTTNPKRRLGYWTDTRFPYLPLEYINALEPLARALGVSEVARGVSPSGRGDRGFLVAFRDADGKPSNLDDISIQDGKQEGYWINKREDFNTRHLAQIRKNKRPLWFTWKGHKTPTRQHIALAMWAYSPEAKRLMRWIEQNESFLESLE